MYIVSSSYDIIVGNSCVGGCGCLFQAGLGLIVLPPIFQVLGLQAYSTMLAVVTISTNILPTFCPNTELNHLPDFEFLLRGILSILQGHGEWGEMGYQDNSL